MVMNTQQRKIKIEPVWKILHQNLEFKPQHNILEIFKKGLKTKYVP